MQPTNSKTQDNSATKTTSSNLASQAQLPVSPDLSLPLLTVGTIHYRHQRGTPRKLRWIELSTNLTGWAISSLRTGSDFWERWWGFKCAEHSRSGFRFGRQLVSSPAKNLILLCSHHESESERTSVGPSRPAKVRRQTVLQVSVGWLSYW